MTTITRIEVFLHRAQQWATVSLLTTLDDLYTRGVRAFEVDVMCKADGRVCFGHPLRPNKWYEESSSEISLWAKQRHVTILLDLKQSASWNPSVPAVARFFETLLRANFLIASYDLETVVRVGQHFGLVPCNISNDLPTHVPNNITLIVPGSVALQLPAHLRDGRVIVSGIQSALEIKSLANAGLSRFMTDKLEIATMPPLTFETFTDSGSHA
jgi:hypothetical protein